MADEGFEFPSQRLSLDVVDHVSAVTGAQRHRVVKVNVAVFLSLLKVLKGLLQIDIWSATYNPAQSSQ